MCSDVGNVLQCLTSCFHHLTNASHYAANAITVIADEVVDRDFGTGCLKITPAHDVNDYETAKRHSLPLINVMNRDASINNVGGPRYEGLDR